MVSQPHDGRVEQLKAQQQIRVISEAQVEVAFKSADVVAPTVPAGVDVSSSFRGEGNLSSVLTAEPGRHEARSQTTDFRS